MKREIYICKCNSIEHQVSFWHDKEDKEVSIEVHLTTHKTFFKRLWVGVKYAFGYKSKYGEWDTMIFKNEDLNKLKKLIIEKEKKTYIHGESTFKDMNYGEIAQQHQDTFAKIGCKHCGVEKTGFLFDDKCEFCGLSYFTDNKGDRTGGGN